MRQAIDGRARDPRVLGDFVLGDKLGEGGFGTVYRAEQRSLGRPAVVKVMRRSLASRPDAVERFVREARLASRFDHPYAAHVYAFGSEPDGLHWIAMELVRGTPLDELIATTGPIAPERFVPLMERLCEAIQTAHEQGIVHRDIKPSNVMVIARAGRLMPKLLDFGIAKLVSGDAGGPIVPLSSVRRDVLADGTFDPNATFVLHTPPELERTADAESAGATGEPRSEHGLTGEGQILGSPVYMAPEQWLDAARVGPWTDQYALALLAYEALTGRRAFDAATLEQLARRHLEAPLPRLPSHLPAALHAVLARAAAKQPAARYASVAELAATLRSASGGGEVDEPPPALAADVRTAWVEDAPQPIAEAIAALATARSAARVVDRVGIVGSIVVRWLGALAVACRSRLGRLDPAIDGPETELLDALRRRPLRDDEWLDLARAVIRPFRDRPEVWPIPEMVEMLANAERVANLSALIHGGSLAAIDDDDREPARRIAADRIAKLASALSQLGWLCDYEVAREVAGGYELWMGVRTDERVMRRTAVGHDGGRVVVLDGDGAAVAVLSPVIEVASPAAGEPPELFVIAGPSRDGSAARSCAYPRGFERDDAAVWTWFADHLIADHARGMVDATPDDRPPYPGLAAFTTDDRASFVGREREVEDVVNRLRANSLVTVVGPSGAGKTSFVAAGVVPALPPSWRAEIVRPGGEPIAALGALVERIERSQSPYRDAPRRATPTTAADLAARLSRAASDLAVTLVIAVDQAEELFSMCDDESARAEFAAALIAATGDTHVRIVVAMRDDFLCRAEALPAWNGRLTRALHILAVPGADDLVRIVTEPARRRGHDFDDPELPSAMVAAVRDRPGALPLLAFTAARLWDERDRHFRRLTRASYDRIGGVTGALAGHADAVIDGMAVADRRLVRLAFRRLLTTDGTRAFIGRADLAAAIGGTPAAAGVVDRLIAARLVVSHDDEAGDRVEVIHEALVDGWPRLAGWRRDDIAGAKLGEQLAAGARHWDDRGRPSGLLWRDDALIELRRWYEDGDHVASPIEDAFVDASRLAARRARRRKIVAASSVLAILVAGVTVLAWANRRIAGQRADAVRRLAASLEERGRQAVVDGDPPHALVYLAEARRLGARGTAFDLLTTFAATPIEARSAELVRPGIPIVFGGVVGDRAYALGSDATARVWSAIDGTPLATGPAAGATIDVKLAGDALITVSTTNTLDYHDLASGRRWTRDTGLTGRNSIVADARAGLVVTIGLDDGIARSWSLADGSPRGELARDVVDVAFGDDGRRLAIAALSGAVDIRDAATGAATATCPAGSAVHQLRFVPDANTIVIGGADGEVRVCDTSTGAAVHRLVGHRDVVTSLAVTLDGRRIVSTSRDGTARVWDRATGAPVAVLQGGRGMVRGAALSTGDTHVLTAHADGMARAWDLETGVLLAALHGDAAIRAIGEVADRVLTIGADGAIRTWNIDRATRARSLVSRSGPIADLQLSSDDRWAVIGGSDGTAVVWDRAADRSPASLRASDRPLASAAVDRGGTAAVTVGDGAWLWSIPDGGVTPLVGHRGPVHTAAFSVDGRTIATGGDDRTLRLWSTGGAALAAFELAVPVYQLAFDPSGRTIVVENGTDATVIDVATRTEIARIPATGGQVMRLAVSKNRIAIASGAVVELFDLATRARLHRIDGHDGWIHQLVFLPGDRLATASEGAIRIWDRDGAIVASMPAAGNRIQVLDASDDGALLAVGHGDGSVRVWDLAGRRLLLVLPGHRGPIANLRFTRDGEHLITAGDDGRAVEWDLRRPSRSYSDLAELVRCRVPLELRGDIALPRDLPHDDATCRRPRE